MRRRANPIGLATMVAFGVLGVGWATLGRAAAGAEGIDPAPRTAVGAGVADEDAYREALARLDAYLGDRCGVAPAARSCDWAVRHRSDIVADGAVVTGATTSESLSRAFVFETLNRRLSGDDTAMRGILDYVRTVAMPHDGRAEPAATSPGVWDP